MGFLDGKKSDRKARLARYQSLLVRIDAFDKDIRQQEDILYGIALFHECISALHAGQDAVIETYSKQFRNVIRNGRRAIEEARALRDRVRNDPESVELLDEFRFSPCQGHPNSKQLAKRAVALVNAYNKAFPRRPRADPFTEAEVLTLLDTAVDQFDPPEGG